MQIGAPMALPIVMAIQDHATAAALQVLPRHRLIHEVVARRKRASRTRPISDRHQETLDRLVGQLKSVGPSD